MRITQGTFSFLPDLTDDQIRRQIAYCMRNNYAVGIEYTNDPHPRNTYWEMWGQPMFDMRDVEGIFFEFEACRKARAEDYIRIVAFDSTHGWESLRLSFIAHRPKEEPSFALERHETRGRNVQYTVRPSDPN